MDVFYWSIYVKVLKSKVVQVFHKISQMYIYRWRKRTSIFKTLEVGVVRDLNSMYDIISFNLSTTDERKKS